MEDKEPKEEVSEKNSDDIVSNYKASYEYLFSIYNSEKSRFDNFNVRSNWILVFLGVLVVTVKFFWIESIECIAKSILSFLFLLALISLLAADSLLCLYLMVPKTKFETTSCDSFIGDRLDKFVHRDQEFVYKTLINQVAPKAKLYYIENERKAKLIKKAYIIASAIVVVELILLILKFC